MTSILPFLRLAIARIASNRVLLATVGLGTGSTACLTEAGDTITYYEIDPAILRIAKDPKRFTFLAECAPDAKIVVGDARLTLADAPDGEYDVIVVDAFTSDAIPVHLLTREALELYFRKLKPNGIVAMHVSNRNLELATVVAGIAQSHRTAQELLSCRAGPFGPAGCR